MHKSLVARPPTPGRAVPLFAAVYAALIAVALIAPAALPLGAAAASPVPPAAAGGKYLVYVGTYTDKGSKGISAYRFDTWSGEIEPVGLVATVDEPTFLATDPSHKFLYAVNEVSSFQGSATGSVSAFSINATTGGLVALNQIPSRGPGPAHLAVDHSGKFVMVANYAGGSVAVFPIQPNGGLGDASGFVQHQGSSVNKDRQAGPHAHEIVFSPDNRFAFVPDLGLDQLIAYPFDAANGALAKPLVAQLTSGFGPRHLVFSPDGQYIYLLNELSSTITLLAYDPDSGRTSSRQVMRIAPPDAEKKSGAEVQIDPAGNFLYASNRGTDMLVVFAIDKSNGSLTRSESVALPGKTPRQFTLDPSGRWLWDANQDSDNIILYQVDAQTGGLRPSGITLKVASPACVTFVPVS
jgi:6-phosphogluconolactonase